jgi:hypothetical protein
LLFVTDVNFVWLTNSDKSLHYLHEMLNQIIPKLNESFKFMTFLKVQKKQNNTKCNIKINQGNRNNLPAIVHLVLKHVCLVVSYIFAFSMNINF